jgi:hemolysin III
MGSRYEHWADVGVQGAGLLASIIGVVILAHLSVGNAGGIALAAVLTYGSTLVAMFLASLLNATLRHPVIRLVDHSVIYLLIAGTYTPFCLMVIGGERGAVLLVGVWLAAALGVGLRVLFHRRLKGAVITLYVAMGWCGLIHADVIFARLHTGALALLAIGGVLYTVGAPLHRLSRLKFHSAIWHSFVFAAAACHYVAIVLILSAFQGAPTA